MDMPKFIVVYLYRDEDGDRWKSKVFISKEDLEEWEEDARYDPEIVGIWTLIEIPESYRDPEKRRHL